MDPGALKSIFYESAFRATPAAQLCWGRLDGRRGSCVQGKPWQGYTAAGLRAFDRSPGAAPVGEGPPSPSSCLLPRCLLWGARRLARGPSTLVSGGGEVVGFRGVLAAGARLGPRALRPMPDPHGGWLGQARVGSPATQPAGQPACPGFATRLDGPAGPTRLGGWPVRAWPGNHRVPAGLAAGLTVGQPGRWAPGRLTERPGGQLEP